MQIGPLSDRAVAGESKWMGQKNVRLLPRSTSLYLALPRFTSLRNRRLTPIVCLTCTDSFA